MKAVVLALAPLLALAACDRGGTSTTTDPQESADAAGKAALPPGTSDTDSMAYKDGVYYDQATGTGATTAASSGGTATAVQAVPTPNPASGVQPNPAAQQGTTPLAGDHEH